MMKNNSFVALILTHERPDNVHTIKTLRKCGYAGDIIIVLDNEDLKIGRYRENYENIYVFDKKEIASETNGGDNFNDRRAIIYARNVSFEVTKEKGYQYFIELDDDYTKFSYTYNQYGEMKQENIINPDKILNALTGFKNKTDALVVASARRGDFIGGKQNNIVRSELLKRKAMSSFICDTNMPFKFFGKTDEDISTYTLLSSRRNLFFRISHVSLNRVTTQQSNDGATGIHLDSGTYVKSFYTIMYAPSHAKIRPMGSVYKRLHRSINWNNAVPKIVPGGYKR